MKKNQAQYHKKMQAVFKKNNFAFMSWTLYDFPHVQIRLQVNGLGKETKNALIY
jgi:hypothetical protein